MTRAETDNEATAMYPPKPQVTVEAKETLEHKAANQEDNKIIAGFNAGYLIESINACSGDEVVIGLNGPTENQDQPAEKKTRTEGTLVFSPSDNNTRYVVMPYNI